MKPVYEPVNETTYLNKHQLVSELKRDGFTRTEVEHGIRAVVKSTGTVFHLRNFLYDYTIRYIHGEQRRWTIDCTYNPYLVMKGVQGK